MSTDTSNKSPKLLDIERILTTDLRGLSDAEMAALTSEAIRLQIPLATYLGQIVRETAAGICGERKPAA